MYSVIVYNCINYGSPLSGIGDISQIWLSSVLVLLISSSQRLLYYLFLQSFDYERTWWRLFQKRVVFAKLDLYVSLIVFYFDMHLIVQHDCECILIWIILWSRPNSNYFESVPTAWYYLCFIFHSSYLLLYMFVFYHKIISNEMSNLRNKRSYINTNINNTNVLNYKVCQWHEAGRWFSPSTPVYTTNKTDHHDIFKHCWNGVKHHSHNLSYDINVKLNNKKKTSFKLVFYLIFIIFHPDYIVI